MHIRSRLHHRRLQISLIDTRRNDGEVRQEHVASLGSVPPDPGVQDRLAFWTKVHPRLARLDNRLDPATRGRIMGELHELVPMVPLDAAVADKVNIAAGNVRQSAAMRDMFQETVDAKKAMVAKLERDIAEGEAHVAEMAAIVERDQDKLRRLEAGEDVPVLAISYAAVRAMLKRAGWTRSDINRAERMAELDKAGFEEYLAERRRRPPSDEKRRETRALNRFIARRRRAADGDGPDCA
jgi:hypothetical protein